MNLIKANNYLIAQGFPSKYVYAGLSAGTPFHNVFVKWQMESNAKKPITFLISEDIDKLYQFSTCAARLFYLNNFTSEIINSNLIADGYFGKSFFVIVEDGYALNVSHKDNLKVLITDRIKTERPLLFQLLKFEDLAFLGEDFMKSIGKNLLVVEV